MTSVTARETLGQSKDKFLLSYQAAVCVHHHLDLFDSKVVVLILGC